MILVILFRFIHLQKKYRKFNKTLGMKVQRLDNKKYCNNIFKKAKHKRKKKHQKIYRKYKVISMEENKNN